MPSLRPIDGIKVAMRLWIEQNQGAKFWLRVMNELKNRGVEDIMLAVVDGLQGLPAAITAVFPEAIVQTCIVHCKTVCPPRCLRWLALHCVSEGCSGWPSRSSSPEDEPWTSI